MNGNLYLTGFMGAGKTTCGKELANVLKRRFVDLDDLVAKNLGMSAQEAFADLGEQAFRNAETLELSRISEQSRLVIATGGGACVSTSNRAIMRANGHIINLKADLETCQKRINPLERSQRPLWQDQKALEELFAQRQQAYKDSDLAVNADQGPTRITDEILNWLIPTNEFAMDLAGQKCKVISTWQAPYKLAEFAKGRRVVLLTDRNLADLHIKRFIEVLDDPFVITVLPGERSKSLKSSEKIYKTMLKNNIERGDLLVALGGGVITDLGAFIAATYKRGMDSILISTSLLGCVDAAVGGKSAVNLAGEKNQVGLFTCPKAVILDIKALTTLKSNHLKEGLTEAYKTGLVADPPLLNLLKTDLKSLLAGDIQGLAKVVNYSAGAKARVVTEDFRESGHRKILNLGHTLGHAVEALLKPRPSHGKAVAIGMKAVVAVSLKRGLLEEQTAREMQNNLDRLTGRKIKFPPINELWQVMQNDKKNQKGKITFVLLKGPGRPLITDNVTIEELAQALEQIEGE